MSKFVKGQSGNPQGKPKGLLNHKTRLMMLLGDSEDELYTKALELALEGNEQMLKLLLDRLLPAKPKDNPLDSLGSLPEGLSASGRKVLKLMSKGSITPSEGNSVMQGILSQAQLIETDELIERITNLENKTHGKK